MVLRTALTELLGIEHPVIQGGMQYVGYAEMASAVSNAGGLGILTGCVERLQRTVPRCRCPAFIASFVMKAASARDL